MDINQLKICFFTFAAMEPYHCTSSECAWQQETGGSYLLSQTLDKRETLIRGRRHIM